MLLHKLIEHPSPCIVRQWINISCLSPWSICGLISLSFPFFPFSSYLFQAEISYIVSLERNSLPILTIIVAFWCVLIYTHTYTHRYIYTLLLLLPFWVRKIYFLQCSKRVYIMDLYRGWMWFFILFSQPFLITLNFIITFFWLPLKLFL